MLQSTEQIRISAQLLVMDALLEKARAASTPVVSASEIALEQILRILSESQTPDSASLNRAFSIASEGAHGVC